ncbi:MAG: bifunctional DNA-formamidopyrimidine glycosylase/DNA-(apurinic or apyrimidinic site) lyase [Rhodospirillaceae bacterium]|nr:MAG: bifunctional DNA-formamidopyrimidine glycosylase/DNA-(apurinic or apyrimidinic site) lyase [Rhodospirillaceae bacterium]
MPELPEVETVCRGLAPLLSGRRLARVEVRRRDLRIPFPPGFAASLTGRRVDGIRRRAKYILIDLDDGQVLIIHLGMAGRMQITDPRVPLGPHDHVIFTTDDDCQIRFNDPRRFGLMTLTPADKLAEHKLFRHLGPDPLEDTFTAEILSSALKGRKTSIKAALLDQRIVVGVGNIYACESLHRAGISPKRKAGTVAGALARRLVPAIKKVLKDAIAAGGSSLRDHVQVSGELGYFQHAWRVYGREGESCKHCKTAIVTRIVQGGRSTFYCRNCQR